ncbi:hypothetical protein B9Z65_7834 [Elsinoe australis]|uniref:Uncharacterized protein n=1 Tax=Elsinoe australis TaxID=40998 RepID=A0A2P8A0N0_9PEZI|nr:hypothetical protein B9Z65_7834 [Elsinoe australis]
MRERKSNDEPLPYPPFMDPLAQGAKRRHQARKPVQDKAPLTPLQQDLVSNPYVRIFLSPLRQDALTNLLLPRFFLQSFSTALVPLKSPPKGSRPSHSNPDPSTPTDALSSPAHEPPPEPRARSRPTLLPTTSPLISGQLQGRVKRKSSSPPKGPLSTRPTDPSDPTGPANGGEGTTVLPANPVTYAPLSATLLRALHSTQRWRQLVTAQHETRFEMERRQWGFSLQEALFWAGQGCYDQVAEGMGGAGRRGELIGFSGGDLRREMERRAEGKEEGEGEERMGQGWVDEEEGREMEAEGKQAQGEWAIAVFGTPPPEQITVQQWLELWAGMVPGRQVRREWRFFLPALMGERRGADERLEKLREFVVQKVRNGVRDRQDGARQEAEGAEEWQAVAFRVDGGTNKAAMALMRLELFYCEGGRWDAESKERLWERWREEQLHGPNEKKNLGDTRPRDTRRNGTGNTLI